jgi:hypothetical protein
VLLRKCTHVSTSCVHVRIQILLKFVAAIEIGPLSPSFDFHQNCLKHYLKLVENGLADKLTDGPTNGQTDLIM